MDSQLQSVRKVARYRVTIDFTVSEANCLPSSNWNWNKLLELNDRTERRVKSLYVENLGEIAYTKCSTGGNLMGKVKQTDNKCFEDIEAFIKRLSDNDDNFSDDIYEGYVTEIEYNLMTIVKQIGC